MKNTNMTRNGKVIETYKKDMKQDVPIGGMVIFKTQDLSEECEKKPSLLKLGAIRRHLVRRKNQIGLDCILRATFVEA